MIIDGTRLAVTDNSGAKEVECIKTRGRYASIGDIITCSVKKAIKGKVSQVRRPSLRPWAPLAASLCVFLGPGAARSCTQARKSALGLAGGAQRLHTAAAAAAACGLPPPLPAHTCSALWSVAPTRCLLHPLQCSPAAALQGQVVKAVVVETKKEVQRKDGRWVLCCCGCCWGGAGSRG